MELSSGRRWLLALVCAMAVSVVYVAQPSLPQMGADLGASPGSLGWIVAAGQIGYLVGLVGIVPLGDRLDRRRLMAGCLVLAAAGLAVAATAQTLRVLLPAVALAGVFAVVVQVAVAFAADLSDESRRGRTLGFVTSGVIVGILGARVVAGALASAWGWRSVYAALALALALLAVLVSTTLPPDRRQPSSAPRGSQWRTLTQLLRDRVFLSRGLIAFFLFASFGTVWSGLALPLSASPWHLSEAAIGLFGLAALAGALGAGRAGRWADRGRADVVTGGALVLLIVSWVAIGWAPVALWPVVIGVVVLDFAVQVVHVSNQTVLTARHRARTSAVIGSYMVFYSLGSVLGATATTEAFARGGWLVSSTVGAAFAGCALVVWALGRRSPRRAGA